MSKIYVFSFGCANRYLDGEKYKKFFIANGHEITTQPEDADYILINTCAFRKNEENRGLEKIKEFDKRKKPGAQIIVCGCLPGINKQRMIQVFNGESFTPQNSDKLNELFSAKIPVESIRDTNKFQWQKAKTFKEIVKSIKTISKKELLKKTVNYFRAKFFDKKAKQMLDERFYIRISNGCLGNCTYCGIKFAIGKLRSKPLEIIIDEFKKGIKCGFKKFVLTSDDSGAYGLDIGHNFPELLKQLANISKEAELEIEELNARWLVQYKNELKDILKTQKFTNFWIAIQSGSDDILAKMNRQTTEGIEQVITCLQDIKREVPHLNIKAQYIVGFPGETVDDANASVESIIKSKINAVNLFKFDPKPNTEASIMSNQLPDHVIEERIRQMTKELKKHHVQVFTNN